MKFKIYVINLQRAEARLATMTKKLAELGLTFERIEAVDGKATPEVIRKAFAQARPRKNGWTPGSFGCFSSHFEAWKRIAGGSAEFGVVFEDDVHISQRLSGFLADLNIYAGEFDILRLEATKHRMGLSQKNYYPMIDGGEIREVLSESWGAGGYVMPRRIARILIARPVADHQPADIYLFDKHHSAVARKLRIYQSIPGMCVQSKFDIAMGTPGVNHGSDIEHNSEGSGLAYWMRRLKWKLNGLKNVLLGYRRVDLANDIVRM